MRVIKTNINLSKKIIIIGCIGLVLIGAGGYLFYNNRNKSQRTATIPNDNESYGVNEINYGPPTPEETDETNQQKEQIIKDYENSQNPSQPVTISLSIGRADQGGPGQPLNIRTIITGATTGTCTVNLKKSGQPTITKSFAFSVEGTYSMCQQADIPAGEFGTGGDWTLEVIAKNTSATSELVTQTVTIAK